MRILWIDDEVSFLKVGLKMLKTCGQEGDEFLSAENGTTGMELIRGRNPDLILTDLKLPDQSGLDILRAAKEHRPDIEIIVVTGQASLDSAIEAMKLGARDYLVKPIQFAELREKVQTIRELIDRTAEAEDYRYAKEVIEGQAARTVHELEACLQEHRTREREARAILAGETAPAEKLEKLKTLWPESS